MSPISVTPGRSAVKSRATRSATAVADSPGMVVHLYGFGCSVTKFNSRISVRTNSGPPFRQRGAARRGYAETRKRRRRGRTA